MPRLSKELVEHRLPIKANFRPYKQGAWDFKPEIIRRVKEGVDRLLQARFIQPCCYAEWVSNLNRATPKDEYTLPVADLLVDSTSGNKVISFLDGNAGYNQIFMVKEGVSKTVFRCPRFVGLFEWVLMIFGLKNASATY
jgi:hypothetical protein